MNFIIDILKTNNGVGFLEYSVLAIICTALYGFALIEIIVQRIRRPNSDLDEMRKAAQWALSGVFITLITGIIAEFNFILPYGFIETGLLSIPLFFMAKWLIWYKEYSKIISDFDTLYAEMDSTFEHAVLEYINSFPGEEILREKLLTAPLLKSTAINSMAAIQNKARQVRVFGTLNELLDLFVLTDERLTRIVDSLKRKGKLEILENGAIRSLLQDN